MALRSVWSGIWWAKYLVVVLMLMGLNAAQAEQVSLKTNLGELTIPDSWQSEQVSKTHFSMWSEDGTSRVDLYQRGFELLSEYLHKRADELHISRYVRRVSREFQDEVNADRGGFILGFVPENDSIAEVSNPEEWEDMDWSEIDEMDAVYLFVVAYEHRGKLFVMEAKASTANGGARLLSDIHRSWTLP